MWNSDKNTSDADSLSEEKASPPVTKRDDNWK